MHSGWSSFMIVNHKNVLIVNNHFILLQEYNDLKSRHMHIFVCTAMVKINAFEIYVKIGG